VNRVPVAGIWPQGRCDRGHDLSVEGAWLYASNGVRTCRECARQAKARKGPNTKIGRWQD